MDIRLEILGKGDTAKSYLKLFLVRIEESNK